MVCSMESMVVGYVVETKGRYYQYSRLPPFYHVVPTQYIGPKCSYSCRWLGFLEYLGTSILLDGPVTQPTMISYIGILEGTLGSEHNTSRSNYSQVV